MIQEAQKAPTASAAQPAEPAGRKTFVAPMHKAHGDLQIHFCSGINLWDGTGGTLQCK